MSTPYVYPYGITVNGDIVMKTGIATTLSIVGVIAAGAAAYAVNTSVLGASANTNVSSATPVSTTTTVAPQSGVAAVSSAAVETVQNVVSGDTTTYKVGAAGSVVIDTSSGAIVVTSILPAAGFTSEPARTTAQGDVKVHFMSKTQRIEFMARLVNGSVVIDVVNETPAPDAAKPPARYNDDDDDDDDDEREDHDDERDDD